MGDYLGIRNFPFSHKTFVINYLGKTIQTQSFSGEHNTFAKNVKAFFHQLNTFFFVLFFTRGRGSVMNRRNIIYLKKKNKNKNLFD